MSIRPSRLDRQQEQQQSGHPEIHFDQPTFERRRGSRQVVHGARRGIREGSDRSRFQDCVEKRSGAGVSSPSKSVGGGVDYRYGEGSCGERSQGDRARGEGDERDPRSRIVERQQGGERSRDASSGGWIGKGSGHVQHREQLVGGDQRREIDPCVGQRQGDVGRSETVDGDEEIGRGEATVHERPHPTVQRPGIGQDRPTIENARQRERSPDDCPRGGPPSIVRRRTLGSPSLRQQSGHGGVPVEKESQTVRHLHDPEARSSGSCAQGGLEIGSDRRGCVHRPRRGRNSSFRAAPRLLRSPTRSADRSPILHVLLPRSEGRGGGRRNVHVHRHHLVGQQPRRISHLRETGL